MDFKTIADGLFPYWILGACVVSAVVLSGNKFLLRAEKKPVVKWLAFLGLITAYRLILTKLFPTFHGMGDSAKNMSIIPWPVALTVFWEDACHGLPLLLLKKLLPTSKKMTLLYTCILGIVMFEFGIGHLYQGVVPAVLLSFYVPYSVKIGEKYGFGTVIIGHMMYDLVTMLFVQYLLGT